MMRKILLIMYFTMILLLAACGKKEEKPEMVVVGNGGNLINVDSISAPSGESDNEGSTLEIGKEKSDIIAIIIDWDKILIQDSEYNNIEKMKDQIVKSGCKKIDLQHTDASKETLDEVVEALKEIEETLEIDINYN